MPATTMTSGLRDQLRALPDDAFTRLQYLAPAIGCFNRCAFCSQSAGRDVWQLTRTGLVAVLTTLADVAAERGLTIAGGRVHRPGVIFPYLDNDIGSYPHLDTYAQLARDVLGVKLRVSTVGYSSRSERLTTMHRRLVAEHGAVFDGIRFSITPYTLGYTEQGPGLSRDAYVEDLAAALATYRPLLDRLGHGAATAACELRFAPLLGTGELTDTVTGGRHVLHCRPHLLIAHQPDGDVPLPETVIERLDENTQPVFSRPGAPYLHVIADATEPTDVVVRAALAGELTVPHRARTVRLHRFANADGPYYAADPDFHPDGTFTALQLYPKTETRKASGYTDATRWFLNTLLGHKARLGLGRRDEHQPATGADVDAVLGALTDQGYALERIDRRATAHLRGHIHPQVAAYAAALERAGYPPSMFFSRRFTIDTGQIVNQGRAQGLFRGLAATNGEPMTPREERGFGQVSLSTVRGPVWRITPLPLIPAGHLPLTVTGKKNPAVAEPSLLVEELDPCHLSPVMRATGCRLRSHRITLPDGIVEHVGLKQGREDFALPGLAA
ncbi:hypothetical protein ACFP1Z_33070 [Streptomyces gamaensis]|uniref:Radical SAM protein n=1 Tax=Streptomyces gamaensis TaxID=1763542 RepID=A0ABW0Z860_9ACTN